MGRKPKVKRKRTLAGSDAPWGSGRVFPGWGDIWKESAHPGCLFCGFIRYWLKHSEEHSGGADVELDEFSVCLKLFCIFSQKIIKSSSTVCGAVREAEM